MGRILLAYGVRNPSTGYCPNPNPNPKPNPNTNTNTNPNASTGYCQGMNFVCGFLLLSGLDEAEAFWALVVIVEYLLPDYYAHDLKGSVSDLKV